MGLTAEQIKLRRKGIGASESPCLVGVSPFGNEISVWCEKMGIEVKASTDSMELGLIMEEGAARLYMRKTGYEVASFGTIRHPKHPFMLATPDLAIFGHRRLAQIKIVGAWMAHHWRDGVPDYVAVQVQHEMEVADADVCDVVAIIGGTDFRILPIERDREMGADLVEVCRSFWERYILTGEMPPVDGSDAADAAIKARFKRKFPTLLQATPESERLGCAWLAEDARITEATKAQAILEQQLKVIVGEHEGIEGESFKLTWSPDKNGKRAFRLKALGSREVAA